MVCFMVIVFKFALLHACWCHTQSHAKPLSPREPAIALEMDHLPVAHAFGAALLESGPAYKNELIWCVLVCCLFQGWRFEV